MGCSAANLAIRPHSSLTSLADGQKVLWACLRSQCGAPAEDTVSEWLRRWTRNPLGSARKGSSPFGVDARACCLPILSHPGCVSGRKTFELYLPSVISLCQKFCPCPQVLVSSKQVASRLWVTNPPLGGAHLHPRALSRPLHGCLATSAARPKRSND